jgi:hypothetical protein
MPARPSGGSRPQPEDRDRLVSRLRFRLGRILVLRECLTLAIVWIMLWAATVVGLRAAFRVDRPVFLWGLPGLALVAVAGILLAVRRLPSPAALRAALDRHGRLGGLLMAAGDTDIGRWSRELTSVPEPALRWRPGRQVMLLAGSIAFLLAALLVPDRVLPAGAKSLEIGGEIQKLAEKLQVLKEEQILPPDRVEALENDLASIRREALGTDPGKTMEAIDHLDRSFSKAAADAAEQAIQDTHAASRVQELAEALQAVQGQLDPKQFAEAMKEMAKLAEQAAEEGNLLAESLSEELKDGLREGELTEEQLRALAEALGECKACQQAKLGKLVEAQLIDGDILILLTEAGEFDPDALIEAILQCEDGDELAVLLASMGLPGRGGITRGPAPPAAMIWQDPVAKEDAAFQEKVLPPGAVASLKESRLAGISAGDPTAAQPSGGSAGGALAAAQAGGGEAQTQVILPQHEKTVQRYFTREQK